METLGPSGQVVRCNRCHTGNPPEARHCQNCGAPLGEQRAAEDATVQMDYGGWSAVQAEAAPPRAGRTLAPGATLSERYEILQLLGQGGMGAVYKARDRELDRLVAVKVIRPEFASDPKTLQRFKQELILARQISQKNVIRIYDMGASDGVKYITMEFVEGRDLSAVMEQRKLTPAECARIVRQVARALDAAHAESVVHRDLKPQNIMLTDNGHVCVMDFGLARSMEMSGLTQTGALMGTPAYMSPEQARGTTADWRSDIFSLGIILYEMLTGALPFHAETMLGSLMKRNQELARPPIELDATIPEPLSNVVMKCLATAVEQRYQSAAEIVADLNNYLGDGTETVIAGTVIAPPARKQVVSKWRLVAAGLGVALLGIVIAAFVFRERFGAAPVPKGKAVTLLVCDFMNNTADPVFDGTLEPMFSVALEDAKFVTVLPREQALRVARQLQPGITRLDESQARLVARREGISVVLTGAIEKEGNGYKVAVRAVDSITGKALVARDATAGGKDQVLATVGKLAAPVRRALGDSTPEAAQYAAAETFSTGSLEAAHAYAAAQDMRFQGKTDEAIRQFNRAIELDTNFGSAYAGLGAMHLNMGQRQAAAKYYREAQARIERMTDREKYRTRGQYYLAVLNPEKAIEEFSALVKQYPADVTGLSNLGFAHYIRRDMTKAMEETRRALEIYPKNVPYRNNVALYAMYAGQFEIAAKEAATALEINPGYLKAYVTLALSELAMGRPAKTAEAYKKMEGISALGASSSSMAFADLALYEGRRAEAVALFEKGIAADQAAGRITAVAKKVAALAQIQIEMGQKAALAGLERAVADCKEESVLFPAARAYLEAGLEPKARALAAELDKRLEPVPQAYAKLIDGEIHLKRGRTREAIQAFQAAQKIADTWLGRFDLGRAYLEAGLFTEADSELDKCLKRRGEATDVFLDEVQTFRYFPPVHYYLGRVREGLKSPGAAESYQNFLAIRDKGEADALVTDARKRLGGR